MEVNRVKLRLRLEDGMVSAEPTGGGWHTGEIDLTEDEYHDYRAALGMVERYEDRFRGALGSYGKDMKKRRGWGRGSSDSCPCGRHG